VRDVAEIRASGRITLAVAEEGLERLGIDSRGLTQLDRMLLEALAKSPDRPMGLKSLGVAVGEEEDTIEDVYEPFLIQQGLVAKTPKGRELTAHGRELMGVARGGSGRMF